MRIQDPVAIKSQPLVDLVFGIDLDREREGANDLVIGHVRTQIPFAAALHHDLARVGAGPQLPVMQQQHLAAHVQIKTGVGLIRDPGHDGVATLAMLGKSHSSSPGS